ncbi:MULTISPECIES: DUF5045 domain-containing protein [Bacteroides]|jgi:hypothetical protein|uniref:DUF5045 domain-containing protein n=1 Tax=Bacteroides uniformis TaxID=820 RepID=A0A3E4R7N1_BACUN|nr:DUF5045 domain-containing protein [Bacteroides uniformis]RGL16276.1 DUF5045 domain-containing protein [Bacteroides uniformis]
MKTNFFIVAIVLGASSLVSHAQSMTYFHDASKQAQVTVMEMGAGALTPEVYYTVTHNSYKKGASGTNKNLYRLAANVASIPQVEYADSIKSNLEARAKEEALNMADRKIDVAWLTEGSKIEKRLMTFKNNINALAGKTSNQELTSWQELGGMYDFAIKTTKKAYMPNSERQKQYLAIYQEITKMNDALLLRIRYLATKSQTDRLVAAMSRANHRVSENATAAYNRWRDASTHTGRTNINR